MDLKEESILGDDIRHHWYYIAKGRAMRKILGDMKVPEVLDVGAGSGIFSRQLLDGGFCESAVCVDPNYRQEQSEIHNDKPIKFVKRSGTTTQKLILMMDVLEHVPDDLALLREYTDSMAPGGHVLITVPAFQFMWSPHDVFLEHHRRYTLGEIESLVRKAHMLPVKSRYYFASLFPAAAMMRLYKSLLLQRGAIPARSELKRYPDWLNRSLTVIHDIERGTIFRFNKLFGLSVFCLCRKN
jgi:SAM-dependent methyltransferase